MAVRRLWITTEAATSIINRTYYPGWVASINEGPAVPVVPVEAGIQGVRLEGAGPSRVTFIYRPVYLPPLSSFPSLPLLLRGWRCGSNLTGGNVRRT